MEIPEPLSPANARPQGGGADAVSGEDAASRGITLPAVEVLREQFKSGALGWEAVLDALQRLPKPWATPEWKAWRDAHIGVACAQCGSADGPMVLQHLRQPLSFATLRKLVRADLWAMAREDGHWADPEPKLVERDTCPSCSSTNIRWYKTQTSWRCMRTQGGRPACRHEFVGPVRVMLPDQMQWAAAKQANWQAFVEANDDLISDQALEMSFDESREYLGMEHTTTFCKKCAFLWDQKGMRLCGCGQGYHSHETASCRDCRYGGGDAARP